VCEREREETERESERERRRERDREIMLISTYLPIGVSNISYVSLGRLSSVSGEFRQSRENFVSLGRISSVSGERAGKIKRPREEIERAQAR